MSATTYGSLLLNNASGGNLNGAATVNGTMTLSNGILSTGTNTLTLSASGTTARGGGCALTTCFVTSSSGGGLKKQFSGAPPSFVFTVGTTGGTTNGYSPVALATIIPVVTGDLTVRAVNSVSPSPITPPKITRYWELTGSNLTANISFTYLDGDVVGDETKYRVYKNSANQCATDCVDEATNTGTVNAVNSFSNWTIAELVPTAASAAINGRIVDSKGRGISKLTVMLVGGSLAEPKSTLTDFFGNYRFENLPAGETYIITPSSKRYRFTPESRVQSLTEDLTGIDFVGNQQSP